MKTKLKKFLFSGIFAVLLVSCTTEEKYYVTEEKYYVTEEHVHNYNATWTFVDEYTIGTREKPWLYDQGDDLFYCHVYIVELTQKIYDEGLIAGYYVNDLGNLKVDTPLPYSDFRIRHDEQWLYQYTCEFSPGKVTFIYKDSDSKYASDNLPRPTFAVKMIR